MDDDEKLHPKTTRRSLLTSAGRLAVGTAALAVSGGGAGLLATAAARETKLPWPYKKLNPDEVGEITYDRWYTGLCTNAVLTGIFTPLRKSVGEPYTSFPVDSFVWGHGGVVGWGTMCGTMLGASIASNLICGPGVAKGGEQVANEVIHFYAGNDLPTFKPRSPKIAADIPTSRSDSPLCHVSVGTWMKKAQRGFWSAERKERCARLAANVAIQTAKHLNDWADGKFKAEHVLPALTYDITAQHNCADCHGENVPTPVTIDNPKK
jgi:hypothetical protein